MSASTVIFYILSGIILGGGWLAVTSRKIFRAAVFLLFSLVGIAGLYFYLNYEFLGAVQIVVYVGGIVVLLIFSIFLTSDAGSDMKKPTFLRAFFSALAASCGTALVCTVYAWHHFTMSTSSVMEPTARNIGRLMLSTGDKGYMLPFEVISILLLIAMVGCIVIAIKSKDKDIPASTDTIKKETL